ncbi:hypothetical protein HUZ88_14430 [Citrobacter portucalensis]|uniref:sugar phosphate nucleotidyltransferase n=1 Tax=Citrobacter portucalensis TaxID=1639133 RepID=UPI0030B9B979|nr:hypothetical protein HUZ88_14430 [Citrobacter portucalensis]
MIGVILAAGVGSRLRPMTNDKPKCLVTVAGKSILDYQLGNDSNLLIVFYVQIMPDDFVMQLHRF